VQPEAIRSESAERKLSYVLITAARNEDAFIEQTIISVINQTVLPLKWIIVSDGSTDRTDDIVKSYAASHPWIHLIRMPERQERHFAGKAHAFNTGYEIIKKETYDVIGNIDADIAFDKDYMEFLLRKISEKPRLGVTGTPFREESQQYDYRFTSVEHVSGACQLFRRECFEEVGGYMPLKAGGVDLNAVLTARMKGWKTKTFTEKVCEHHRKMGTATRSNLKGKFKHGFLDYLMGVNIIWQAFRSVYQMSRKPFMIGGLAILAGYIWAMVSGSERQVSSEVVKFRKKEQMKRLRAFFFEN
jgi:glycosyltransferase involved in cell wall biosynthesis